MFDLLPHPNHSKDLWMLMSRYATEKNDQRQRLRGREVRLQIRIREEEERAAPPSDKLRRNGLQQMRDEGATI